MTMCAAGVPKLIEECGELIQVLGKKLAWWDTQEPHWDGTNLDTRLEEEMGDVIAAIEFVCDRLGLDGTAMEMRATAKLSVYEAWDADMSNNTHGIDARTP